MKNKINFQNYILFPIAVMALGIAAISCAHLDNHVNTGAPEIAVAKNLPVPVSLVVGNGLVKRGMPGRFYPLATVRYSNGEKLEGYIHSGFKKLMENMTLSFSPNIVTFKNGRFERIPGVKDETVTCRWTYRENGASVVAESSVTVTGQPSQLKVGNGQVRPGKKFGPVMTVTYSDGSRMAGFQHMFGRERPELVTANPPAVTFKNSLFEIVPGAPAEIVLCHWEFAEGQVRVQADSKVKVNDPHLFRLEECIQNGGIPVGATFTIASPCEAGSSGSSSIDFRDYQFKCRMDLCNLMMFLGDCCGGDKTPLPLQLEDGPAFFLFECLKNEQTVRIKIDFTGDESYVCYLSFSCMELEPLVEQIENCCNCLM